MATYKVNILRGNAVNLPIKTSFRDWNGTVQDISLEDVTDLKCKLLRGLLRRQTVVAHAVTGTDAITLSIPADLEASTYALSMEMKVGDQQLRSLDENFLRVVDSNGTDDDDLFSPEGLTNVVVDIDGRVVTDASGNIVITTTV